MPITKYQSVCYHDPIQNITVINVFLPWTNYPILPKINECDDWMTNFKIVSIEYFKSVFKDFNTKKKLVLKNYLG